MKKLFPILLLLFTSAFRSAAADPLTEAMQQGILAEETQRDLTNAIAAYGQVLKLHTEHAEVAATALFRLAECQRRLGQTNEARANYDRLVREFPGNTRLVNSARQHASTPRGSDEELKLVAVKLQALRDHLASVEKRYLEEQDALTRYESASSSSKLSQAITQFSDSNLSKLLDQKFEAEQRLAALSNVYTDSHPERIRAQTVLKTVSDQIQERLEEVRISRRSLLEADSRRRAQLQEEIIRLARQLEESTRKN